MGKSPAEDGMREVLQRLAALEHRLTAVEQWAGMPKRPPPLPVRVMDEAEAHEKAHPADIAPPPIAAVVPIPKPAPIPVLPLPAKPKRSSASLEAMIGQNWASWAGGIVLLLGISFFLKYAWDQGWIRPSPLARVVATIALGAGLCCIGEYLWRRRMRALAATLHGTGVAIAIAGFFGANRFFDPPVLPAGLAFAWVAVCAAVGVFLALRVNVMTVAVLALIGAYLSPAVLSSGEDKSLELLAYLAILAAAQWALSFLKGIRADEQDHRFHWLGLRWVALIGSFLWFFAWWAGLGERNDHHTMAIAWLALMLVGFQSEIFATLQVALAGTALVDEKPSTSPLARLMVQPINRPYADSGMAIFSLLVTAIVFAAAFAVLGNDSPKLLALFVLALAAALGVVAVMTLSTALAWSALFQAAGLITLAAPLYFDNFSITIAWLALASAVALLAWQLNLPAARAWAIALLILAVARLVALDSFDPAMRTIVLNVADQPISRWLLMAWGTAVLFHLVAWMKPREGSFPAAEQWIDHAAETKRTLQGHLARTGPLVLNYQSGRQMIPIEQHARRLDALGILLAILGTMLFAIASATQWHGAMLTLLGIAWLGAIVSLAPWANRLGYATHAIVLIAIVAMHWLLVDNLHPLFSAWDHPSRDQTLPIVNLPALSAVLLCVAIVMLMRAKLQLSQAVVSVGLLLFAALTFEAWRAVDYSANNGPAISNVATVKQVVTSVLWSLVGFAAIVIGFWRKLQPLRIAALALLGVTLAKIFIVDMKDVQAVWRILSFIALGSLLLGVSYVYHRHEVSNEKSSAPQEHV